MKPRLRWRSDVVVIAWLGGGVLHAAPFQSWAEALDFVERRGIDRGIVWLAVEPR